MEPTSYPMASKRERIFRMSGQHDLAGFNYMHNGSNGNGNSKHELNGRSKALLNGKARAAMELEDSWKGNLRWKGITRLYNAEDVVRLRGSVQFEYTLARLGAEQIQTAEVHGNTYWFAPIVADAEAGFGGPLNVFELMKSMIDAGAAGVHFEDQLSSEKKCGHMGGKVLIPTQSAIKHLVSARLAADVMGVPTLVVARTDANGAHLITSDIDPVDHKLLTGNRTAEGIYQMRG